MTRFKEEYYDKQRKVRPGSGPVGPAVRDEDTERRAIRTSYFQAKAKRKGYPTQAQRQAWKRLM